ncbi:MAG: holo-ACP synthase [Mariprofundaceae bacterium]|nr:holo-ACP synthase [Mariprofundaceae bacterium]
MIVGIGTDRVLIERIERSLVRFGERFEQRVYTDEELRQARAKGHKARRLAMLFAAKEAVSKSLGTGFHQGVAPGDIETVHQASGKPEVFLHGGAQAAAQRIGVDRVHVSLTDDDGVAMAFAVAESRHGAESEEG